MNEVETTKSATTVPEQESMPPIHRIPVELLEDIFAWLTLVDAIGDYEAYSEYEGADAGASSDFELGESDTSDEDMRWDATSDEGSEYSYVSQPDLPLRLSWGWARVTHVCRLWRTVALSSASLWTTFPSHLPFQWLQELVRRSGEAPLDVIDAAVMDRDVNILVQQCVGRIRSIESCGGYDTTESLFIPSFPTVTEMTVYDDLNEGWGLSDIISCQPPLSAFRYAIKDEGTLPTPQFTRTLRELSLTYMPMDFNGSRVKHSFSAENFLDFMAGMPCIEYLHLQRCLPALDVDTPSGFVSGLARVHLPRLRRLTLMDANKPKALSLFLQSVRLPASATVDISCFLGVNESVEPRIPVLPREPHQLSLDDLFLLGRAKSPICTLAILRINEWAFDVHGWRGIRSRSDSSPDFRQSDALSAQSLGATERSTNTGDVHIDYSYDYKVNPERTFHKRWTFFEKPQKVFENIRILSLLLKDPPCLAIDSVEGGLLYFLYAAHGVEHLRLAAYSPAPIHTTAAEILPVLCELEERSSAAQKLVGWKLMPSLRSLTIQNMRPHTEIDASGTTILDALRKVIFARTGSGGALHTVFIHNWMCHDDIALWRAGLEDVNIDVMYDTSMH